MERRNRAKMSYVWFWVRWLPGHTPASAKYQFTKFDSLTVRDPIEQDKSYFGEFLLNTKINFKKNPRRTVKQRKTARMPFIWLRVYWLAGHALKSVKYKFVKFDQPTASDPKEGAKIILRLLFLTRRRVLIKNQTVLPHREHWRILVIFDTGCIGR